MVRLFVGGPADGKRLNVPKDYRHCNVPADYVDDSGKMSTLQTSTLYRLERIEVEGTLLSIFVWEKLRIDEAISMLIKGYKI